MTRTFKPGRGCAMRAAWHIHSHAAVCQIRTVCRPPSDRFRALDAKGRTRGDEASPTPISISRCTAERRASGTPREIPARWTSGGTTQDFTHIGAGSTRDATRRANLTKRILFQSRQCGHRETILPAASSTGGSIQPSNPPVNPRNATPVSSPSGRNSIQRNRGDRSEAAFSFLQTGQIRSLAGSFSEANDAAV